MTSGDTLAAGIIAYHVSCTYYFG